MLLLHADEERQIQLAGVLKPVRRPVEIDETITGFHRLRTLRIYEFETNSIIDGHAEEDEVYLVVLAGSIELTIETSTPEQSISEKLLAPEATTIAPCAAYLPPGSSYKLTCITAASVAYARATPTAGSPPRTFISKPLAENSTCDTLLDCGTYAELLRLRLVAFHPCHTSVSCSPFAGEENALERLACLRLVHAAHSPGAVITHDGKSLKLASSDTVALSAGDRLTLEVDAETLCILLLVLA